jgi:mRNA interferase MazF
VLIVQNDVGNKHSTTTLCIPLTSKRKTNLPTHIYAGSDCGLQYDSIISCEQVRCISKRRLLSNGIIQKIAECPSDIMKKVEVALLKAEGIISLNISEEETIEMIQKVNNITYENNYNNYNQQRQLAYC